MSVYAGYGEERGFPPYDPRLMLKLLLYGYATGTPSSRKLEARTYDDVACRFLCVDQHPDYRSIARFRRRHLEALAELFTQALALCAKAGLVKLGRVALDGTKLRANASRATTVRRSSTSRRRARSLVRPREPARLRLGVRPRSQCSRRAHVPAPLKARAADRGQPDSQRRTPIYSGASSS